MPLSQQAASGERPLALQGGTLNEKRFGPFHRGATPLRTESPALRPIFNRLYSFARNRPADDSK